MLLFQRQLVLHHAGPPCRVVLYFTILRYIFKISNDVPQQSVVLNIVVPYLANSYYTILLSCDMLLCKALYYIIMQSTCTLQSFPEALTSTALFISVVFLLRAILCCIGVLYYIV